ncbi:williams-Beuren syndrome critical region protein 20 copy A [Coniophora puteana RWD-64-598 SS2]|uniref:Williams-Beuren syndrome critical region protein 20 copy A n=1 Tax=Coniophora puteana (strain RWD-64-598) TaxID=741705 RepID=A0A5M3MYK0_CONPW|nr:williams-Beuren syndrome critical region protein 20 copy A [Coniophora puteana RWD-64-598 SS2]EIW84228.1 williams-Beuren syndrome critical region protein 20 copy A [Coniophora puteana RWD-64-598 SS2]
MNFYFDAAKALDRLDSKQGSIKGILASMPQANRARSAALVIETLKYKSVLTEVIHTSKLLAEEKKKITSLNLALVLVHDLLLTSGIQAGDGPVKQAILRHKTRLRSEFQRIKVKRAVTSNLQLINAGDERAERIPRYVRVNTSLCSTEDAVEYFTSQGFRVADPLSDSKAFSKDGHIPDLLAFNPAFRFHDDSWYKSGKLIIQDKASCFPAYVLNPPLGDDRVAIDATSAPGNKTSHLSALMQNRGKIFAFERDKTRFTTLSKMLSIAKCENVEPIRADFLTVDPMDSQYAQVTHILVDPSCSGSGIVNRLDHLLESENKEETDQNELDRLQKLSSFQLLMIKHAMKFPAAQKIVYSTCSIHAEENERVVQHALSSEEAKVAGFTLAPSTSVLPSWNRRGLPEEMGNPSQAASLIRCVPGEDQTNGFFVSCFVRGGKVSSSSMKRPATDLHSHSGSKKRRKAAKK